MTKHDYNSIRISRELLTKIFSHITIQDTGYKTECWLWQEPRPRRYIFLTWRGVQYRLHRLMYCLFVAPMSPALVADHLCFITTCVNPEHIEPVTSRENSLRNRSPLAINAKKTHCPQNHPYAGNNLIFTYSKKRGRFGRRCRTCDQSRQRDRARRMGVPLRTREDADICCKRGHPYPEFLYITKKGHKVCRACGNLLRREKHKLQTA